MKIDEAVIWMERGSICAADCSKGLIFKLDEEERIIFKDINGIDNLWRPANMCPELFKADWTFSKNEINLSEKIFTTTIVGDKVNEDQVKVIKVDDINKFFNKIDDTLSNDGYYDGGKFVCETKIISKMIDKLDSK